MERKELDIKAIASIRGLLIDMINKANSGHPGMALDIAPALYVLFKNHLVSDPKMPNWINRDRFVLSSGHNSALLYATLHVFGYDVKMEEIEKFRQVGSLTPGHPEIGVTAGVDATAGPLGQGIAQAVGMALAERKLRHLYPEGEKLIDHYTYCLCGDGCLEEGISQEAISFAGHQKLNRLILIYDENTSTLDGPTSNSMTEDQLLRFKASEWSVFEVKDGEDIDAIDAAIAEAKKSDKPSMIMIHTKIGYGSPLEGSHKSHGNPLGEEKGAATKQFFGIDWPAFSVPADVEEYVRIPFANRGKEAYEKYERGVKEYSLKHPEAHRDFNNGLIRSVEDYGLAMPEFGGKPDATRNTSGHVVEAIASKLPFTFGGSADVAGSVKTAIPGDPGFDHEHPEGKNLNFGIREFAMAAIQNGILLHGGLVPYVGCFLVFADYLKPAIRMASIEELPAIYLFSHDSIAVGEDGPTHEPIEQLAMLRSIPGVEVFRPADARETYAAWKEALESKDHPVCLILSRQNLPLLEESNTKGVARGAYKVFAPKGKAEWQILATGSEVAPAIEIAKRLEEEGKKIEVISMPSLERFEKEEVSYKEEILSLPYERRISMEMLSTFGWHKYAKNVIGIDRFGLSGKAEEVMKTLGWDVDSLYAKVKGCLR